MLQDMQEKLREERVALAKQQEQEPKQKKMIEEETKWGDISPESSPASSYKRASRPTSTRLSLGTGNDAVPTKDLETLISLAAEFHNIHHLEGDAKKEATDSAFSKLKAIPATEHDQYLVSIHDPSRFPRPNAEGPSTTGKVAPRTRQLRRSIRVDSLENASAGKEQPSQSSGNRASVRVETVRHAEVLHSMLDLAAEMKHAERLEDVERLLGEMSQTFEEDSLKLAIDFDLDDGSDSDLDIDKDLLADLEIICT